MRERILQRILDVLDDVEDFALRFREDTNVPSRFCRHWRLYLGSAFFARGWPKLQRSALFRHPTALDFNGKRVAVSAWCNFTMTCGAGGQASHKHFPNFSGTFRHTPGNTPGTTGSPTLRSRVRF